MKPPSIAALVAVSLLTSSCGDDDPTTSGVAVTYSVTLGVTTASGDLGALQFDVRYRGSEGGWLGAGSGAVCSPTIPVDLATFNDRGEGVLSGAVVDLEGISTPGAVCTCGFKTREAIRPGRFSIQVIDAAGTDNGAASPDPFPRMTVVEIQPIDATQTTTAASTTSVDEAARARDR